MITCPHCPGVMASNASTQLALMNLGKWNELDDVASLASHWSCLLCGIEGAEIKITCVEPPTSAFTLINYKGVIWEIQPVNGFGSVPEGAAAAYRLGGIQGAQDYKAGCADEAIAMSRAMERSA